MNGKLKISSVNMQVRAITIFPSMFDALTEFGITRRAIENDLLEFEAVDLREYGQGAHRQLDDRPFGGGPGMVMLAEPVIDCVAEMRQKMRQDTPVIYMSPQGRRMTQDDVCRFAELPDMIILCGRYEGIDQRALDIICAEEWSIGDYVLTGGELAAMVLIDTIVRQFPGALGNEQSSECDSFSNGLLDCVHYTRPRTVQGLSVPSVLISGDHEAINFWRMKQSIGRTWLRRPDLLDRLDLSDEQRRALSEFQTDHQHQRKT